MLLALYYNVERCQEGLNGLAALKARLGLGFVVPAQIVAGALLPFFFQYLQRGAARSIRLADLPYLALFWGCQGAMINAFYEGQAMVFGSLPTLPVILAKTAVDMLLFTPALFMPLVVWVFAFKNAGYSVERARVAMGPRWYRHKVLPVYVAALLVWTPAVCVMYALPVPLQFPVQALVQIFWALMLTLITPRESGAI